MPWHFGPIYSAPFHDLPLTNCPCGPPNRNRPSKWAFQVPLPAFQRNRVFRSRWQGPCSTALQMGIKDVIGRLNFSGMGAKLKGLASKLPFKKKAPAPEQIEPQFGGGEPQPVTPETPAADDAPQTPSTFEPTAMAESHGPPTTPVSAESLPRNAPIPCFRRPDMAKQNAVSGRDRTRRGRGNSSGSRVQGFRKLGERARLGLWRAR